MTQWTFGNATLHIVQGDLTQMETDAVVNAANSRLAGGGGVDGAIHRAAGHQRLQRACREIIEEIGELPTGQAVVTPGFSLPAKYIIHTVGPIWRGGSENEPQLLADAYDNSLRKATEHGIKTVAFPAISCGVYGFPPDRAAKIALSRLADGLRQGLVREAFMVLRGEASYKTWLDAARDALS
jgi:O-acetyl-ADP-ribose deacetylase (regulator of RNase III)